jgi:tRNA A-37 threonylcarbamoyl transferase component Bud32
MSAKLNIKEMKKLAVKMGILTDGLSKATLSYELGKRSKRKNHTDDGYVFVCKLGMTGRDGNVSCVKHKNRRQYAKKQFRKNRDTNAIKREATFQQQASNAGLSPTVKEFNLNSKYIIMDVVDGESLYARMKKKKGKLSVKQQKELLTIFGKLDTLGIFHKDPNPLNFLFNNDDKLYIIDFGFAEKINKKRHGDAPNMDQMTLGLLIKFKTLFPGVSYNTMRKKLKPGMLQILNGE